MRLGALSVAALLVLASPLRLETPVVAAVPVQFASGGATVHGRFFAAEGTKPEATLLLVPGFPGNPDDVLGFGALLAPKGINVLMFNPRGLHASEGTFSFANTLDDIAAAWRWLQTPDAQREFKIDPARLAIAGHSFGGGMAMAYAARDAGVRHVISIAGNDHGEFVREVQRNPKLAEEVRAMLARTRAPAGPARLGADDGLQELARGQDVYGLRENAGRLADRRVLLIGGWEDMQVTIDQYLLPLYRALKRAGGADVTFVAVHDNHNFVASRSYLASQMHDWLLRGLPR